MGNVFGNARSGIVIKVGAGAFGLWTRLRSGGTVLSAFQKRKRKSQLSLRGNTSILHIRHHLQDYERRRSANCQETRCPHLVQR